MRKSAVGPRRRFETAHFGRAVFCFVVCGVATLAANACSHGGTPLSGARGTGGSGSGSGGGSGGGAGGQDGGSGGGTGAGDDAAAIDPVCAALAQLSLDGVTWTGQPPRPGGSSTLSLSLTNNAQANFPTAPGVALGSANAAVTFDFPEFVLFGLPAGQTATATWTVTFGGALASGTVVPFHAVAIGSSRGPAGNVPCANAGAIDFTVILQ